MVGLSGAHQIENASLAVSLSNMWLNKMFGSENQLKNLLPNYICEGIKETFWPGRSQRYVDQLGLVWFFDGAHTKSSIYSCMEWFISCRDSNYPTYLLFNPAKGRDGASFLNLISSYANHNGVQFQVALFCPNIINLESNFVTTHSFNNGLEKDSKLTLQSALAALWQELNSTESISMTSVQPSISDAVQWLQRHHQANYTNPKCNILVTGSLHLVGGVMTALGHDVV